MIEEEDEPMSQYVISIVGHGDRVLLDVAKVYAYV